MARSFALDEQCTTFTIDATDRTLVRVYSNDPVFIAKLEKVGAKVYRKCEDGGMFYDLRADQLVLRKGKVVKTATQLEAFRKAMQKRSETP